VPPLVESAPERSLAIVRLYRKVPSMSVLDLSFASGENTLSVRRVQIHEGISTLFTLSVWARSPQFDLDLESLVGQPAAFQVVHGTTNVASQGSRRWSGVVSQIEQVQGESGGPGEKPLSTYYLQIVPRLWLLTQRQNYRIYQHLSIPDISDKLLAEWGLQAVWQIDKGSYPRLEYKVQYGESDFAFLSRLWEEAGIAFVFPDDEQGKKIVLGDKLQEGPVREGAPISYVDNPSTAAEQEFVSKVRLAHEVRPGAHTIRDYDFRRPGFPLFGEAPKAAGVEAGYEQYHYQPHGLLVEPGKGGDTPSADDKGIARHEQKAGNERADRTLAGTRTGKVLVSFETNVVDLWPGRRFSMDHHPHAELDSTKKLLITEFSLEATPGGEWQMSASAVFSEVPYRPLVRTPKPKINSVQSATVVGPGGQEIHTDEFGRVRVQFPWDREGKSDDGSSCWIRVSQGWAGTGYGMMVIPRIGHEVLIGFLNGDPDAPIVVGRVFNATERVPYKLPDHKTRSTWKSDSSIGSGGFNEIMFEDLKDTELVYVQAQKNLRKLVKHDETITVGNDRAKDVGNNETDTTLVNRTEVTGVNRSQTVGENRMTFVVGKSEKLIKQNEIEITHGNRRLRVVKDLDLMVKGEKHERIEQDVHLHVDGSRSERIDQSQSLTVIVDQFEEVSGSHALSAGKEIHFSAIEALVAEGNDVTLRAPGGFIRINGAGVTIFGTRVEINVSGTAGHGRGSKPVLPDDPKKAKIKTEDDEDDSGGDAPDKPEELPDLAGELQQATGGGIFDFLKKKKSKNVKLPVHATECRGKMLVQQEKPMSCGQAASRMVIFSRTHKDVPEGTLRDESEKRKNGYDPFNGTSTLDVPSMLGDHGVKPAGTWKRGATVDDMEGAMKKGKPAMVLLRDPGHFVVLDGVETKKDGTKTLLIRDPALPGKKGCRSIDVGGDEWNNRVANPKDPGWIMTLPH
jgi:type VI secretion system secreted protein VgrG